MYKANIFYISDYYSLLFYSRLKFTFETLKTSYKDRVFENGLKACGKRTFGEQ